MTSCLIRINWPKDSENIYCYVFLVSIWIYTNEKQATFISAFLSLKSYLSVLYCFFLFHLDFILFRSLSFFSSCLPPVFPYFPGFIIFLPVRSVHLLKLFDNKSLWNSSKMHFYDSSFKYLFHCGLFLVI